MNSKRYGVPEQQRGRYANRYAEPFKFKRGRNGYDELTIKDSVTPKQTPYDSIYQSNMSFNSPRKGYNYGNEEQEILKHFNIIQSLDLIRKSSSLNSVNLIGPKSGFLTQQNNIYSFNWFDKVPPITLQDYPQQRFDVIYTVKELFSQLMIVAKKGNEVQFVLKRIDGPSRILFTSPYDAFDYRNFKDSVMISKDGTNIAIRYR